MAARESYYAESLAAQTTTSTSAVDALSLTLNPQAGQSYFIIATAEIQNTNTSAAMAAKFVNSTDSVTLNTIQRTINNTGNWVQFCGITKYTDGGSATPKTFKIQYNSTNGTVTAKIRDARITIIAVGANDQYFENTGTVSTGSTPANVINSSFTPPSTGDYTLLWCCDTDNNGNTSTRPEVSVVVGATTYDQNQLGFTFTSKGTSAGCIGLASLAASSQTVQMPFVMSSNVTGIASNGKMVFLRHDGFDDPHFNYQGTAQSVTNTAYQNVTGAALTFTPAADKYLIIGGALQWGGSTSGIVGTQITDGGTTKAETLEAPNSTTTRNPFAFTYIATYTAVSTTWQFQFKSSISTANAQYLNVTALKVGTFSASTTIEWHNLPEEDEVYDYLWDEDETTSLVFDAPNYPPIPFITTPEEDEVYDYLADEDEPPFNVFPAAGSVVAPIQFYVEEDEVYAYLADEDEPPFNVFPAAGSPIAPILFTPEEDEIFDNQAEEDEPPFTPFPAAGNPVGIEGALFSRPEEDEVFDNQWDEDETTQVVFAAVLSTVEFLVSPEEDVIEELVEDDIADQPVFQTDFWQETPEEEEIRLDAAEEEEPGQQIIVPPAIVALTVEWLTSLEEEEIYLDQAEEDDPGVPYIIEPGPPPPTGTNAFIYLAGPTTRTMGLPRLPLMS